MERRKVTLGAITLPEQPLTDVLERIVKSTRLSYGPYCRQFERKVADYHSQKHALFVNSGTSALVLALKAIKELRRIPNNARVAVPAVTFVATAAAVVQAGMVPIPCEIEEETWGIDPDHIPQDVVGIIGVPLLGKPCDMYTLRDVANHLDAFLIEDACEAWGRDGNNGLPFGSFADACILSTYAAHIVCTGAGGLLLTNNKELEVLARSLANHGRDPIYMNIDDDDDLSDPFKRDEMLRRRFSFTHIGHSYRPTEFEAAAGLAQMQVIDKILYGRRMTKSWFQQILPTVPRLDINGMRGTAWVPMNFGMVLPSRELRDAAIVALEEAGVETRLLMPLMDQPAWPQFRQGPVLSHEVAWRVTNQGIYVGCHQDMIVEDVHHIADVLRKVLS